MLSGLTADSLHLMAFHFVHQLKHSGCAYISMLLQALPPHATIEHMLFLKQNFTTTNFLLRKQVFPNKFANCIHVLTWEQVEYGYARMQTAAVNLFLN